MAGNHRLNFSVVLSIIVSLLLTACTTSQEPKDTGPNEPMLSGNITVVTNRTDLIDSKYVEYANLFHQKYPGIKVQFEALRDYDRTIKIRLASGETPDVMLIPPMPQHDLAKFFSPLDDLGYGSKMYFHDFRMYDGVTYGIPSGVSVTGVLYNKKAFSKAGIEQPPLTLSEFYEICNRLKQSGAIPLASNFKDRWPLQVWSNDVAILLAGSSGIKNELAAVDEPFQPGNPYVEAMSIIKKLYEQGFLEPVLTETNWESSKRELANGSIAMMITGNWAVKQIIENGASSEELGFFPFPADQSGVPKVTLYPDRYYAVGKNSKNQAAAKAFIRWMVEDSGYEDYSGFIPALKSKKHQSPQMSELESYNPQYLEVVKDTDLLSRMMNKAQLEMPVLIQEYILGSPKQVLDKFNSQWSYARRSVLEDS